MYPSSLSGPVGGAGGEPSCLTTDQVRLIMVLAMYESSNTSQANGHPRITIPIYVLPIRLVVTPVFRALNNVPYLHKPVCISSLTLHSILTISVYLTLDLTVVMEAPPP
jgi:hypothetical protein